MSALAFQILIVLLLEGFVCSSYHQDARSYGQWTSEIVPETHLGDLPPKYIGCGISMREKRVSVIDHQCNCHHVWHHARRKLKCDQCPSTYSEQVGAIQVYYCDYNKWQHQIMNQTVSSNSNAGGWRGVMCPKDYFIVGAALMFGLRGSFAGNVDLGFTGVQLKCSTINQHDSKMVNNGGRGIYSSFYQALPGQFLIGHKLKFSENSPLWGMGLKFGPAPVISSITINFGQFNNPAITPTIVAQSTTTNNSTLTVTKTSSLIGSKQLQSSYQTSNTEITGYSVSATASLHFGNQASPVSAQISTTYSNYHEKQETFGFGKKILETITSNEEISASIPPCTIVKMKRIMYNRVADIPYTAIITFSDPSNNHFMSNTKISGIWSGAIVDSIKTTVESSPIQQCGES